MNLEARTIRKAVKNAGADYPSKKSLNKRVYFFFSLLIAEKSDPVCCNTDPER